MISTTPRPKQHSLPSTVGPSHHLAALAPLPPDSPPTPTATPTALRTSSTTAPTSPRAEDVSIWLRWALSPASALRVLLAPALLALPTRLLLLLLGPRVASSWVLRIPGWGQWDVPTNPFPAFFLLSHPSLPPSPASLSSPDSVLGLAMTPEWLHGGIGIGGDGTGGRQLYTKGPLDLLLLAWTVVLFSLLRLLFTNTVFPALARAAGIRRPGKVVRFGEQGYSVVYFAVVGVWGVYNMSTTPVGWFATRAFWEGYPHTHLGGAMKRYYLCQIGYWAQQSAVLILGLEKRRSDHWEMVVHHVVTMWMVSWSYLMNVTLLGTAVFVSMDVPDMLLSFSKMLNYLQLEKPKVVSFAVFVVAWTYFRHYISIRILWSLQYEFHLVPKQHQLFSPRTGIYMALWMRDQMFYALCVLQALNLFWYYLIIRILIRTVLNSETDDNRSDAEEEEENVNVNGAVEEKQPALGLAEPKEKGLGASLGRSDSENQNDTACPITPPRTPTPTRAKRGKKEKGAAARVANGGAAAGFSAAPNA